MERLIFLNDWIQATSIQQEMSIKWFKSPTQQEHGSVFTGIGRTLGLYLIAVSGSSVFYMNTNRVILLGTNKIVPVILIAQNRKIDVWSCGGVVCGIRLFDWISYKSGLAVRPFSVLYVHTFIFNIHDRMQSRSPGYLVL